MICLSKRIFKLFYTIYLYAQKTTKNKKEQPGSRQQRGPFDPLSKASAGPREAPLLSYSGTVSRFVHFAPTRPWPKSHSFGGYLCWEIESETVEPST